MKTIGLFIFIIAMYLLGVICLLFPRRIQSLVLKQASWGITGKATFLKVFIQSDSYLISVKAVGIGSLVLASFLLFVVIKTIIES